MGGQDRKLGSVSGAAPFSGMGRVVHLAQRRANLAKTPFARLQNMMTKGRVRRAKGWRKTVKLRCPGWVRFHWRIAPCEKSSQIRRRHPHRPNDPANREPPRLALSSAAYRASALLGAAHIGRNHRSTARLEIRGARQVEPVKAGERCFHRSENLTTFCDIGIGFCFLSFLSKLAIRS